MSKDVTMPLGQIVATPGAIAAAGGDFAGLFPLLARHVAGDWGEVDDEDAKMNDEAVVNGDRVLSSYKVGDEKVWIITEADRSATTFLLPSEY